MCERYSTSQSPSGSKTAIVRGNEWGRKDERVPDTVADQGARSGGGLSIASNHNDRDCGFNARKDVPAQPRASDQGRRLRERLHRAQRGKSCAPHSFPLDALLKHDFPPDRCSPRRACSSTCSAASTRPPPAPSWSCSSAWCARSSTTP